MAKRLHDLFDLGPSVDYWEDPRFCSLLGEDAAMMGASGAGAYSIPYSAYGDGSTGYLSRTPSGAGNRQRWTVSVWVKRNELGTFQTIFYAGSGASPNTRMNFDSSDRLRVANRNSGGTYVSDKITTAVFRDTTAWLHIVADYEAGTFSLYVNGEQITDFSTDVDDGTATDTTWNNTVEHDIGAVGYGSTQYGDQYVTEFIHVDGQSIQNGDLAVTDFGKTDPVTDKWVAKAYTGSYGTNGFYLDFSNAGALGTDTSGNGNDFTVSGTITQSTDTPTNNNATWSPIGASDPGLTATRTFSEGNKRVQIANTGANVAISTLKAPNDMALWWETECVSISGTVETGVYFGDQWDVGSWLTSAVTYKSDGNKRDAGSTSAYGATYTATDVIGWHYDGAGTLTAYKQTGGSGSFVSQGTIKTGITGPIYFYVVDSGTGPTPDFRLKVAESEWNNTAPPSGAKALCTDNLPQVTIKNVEKCLLLVSGDGDGIEAAVSSAMSAADWGSDAYSITYKNLDSIESNLMVFSDDASYAFELDDATGGKVAFSGLSGTDRYHARVERLTSSYNAATGVESHTSGVATTVTHSLGSTDVVIEMWDADNADNRHYYHPSNTSGKLFYYNGTAAETTDAAITNITSNSFDIDTGEATGDKRWRVRAANDVRKYGEYDGTGATPGPFVNEMLSPAQIIGKEKTTASNFNIWDQERNPFNNDLWLSLYLNSDAVEGSGVLGLDVYAVGFAPTDTSGSRWNDGSATICYEMYGNPTGGQNTVEATGW